MSTPRTIESGFESFHQLVLGDRLLQEELAAITDREAFIRRAVELGQQHGVPMQPADVVAALHAARSSWMDSQMV